VGYETVPVHYELVTLGLSTKDRMIIEHEAGRAFARQTLEEQRGRKSADTASHHYAVVNLASVDEVLGKRVELAFADLMSGIHDLFGISV